MENNYLNINLQHTELDVVCLNTGIFQDHPASVVIN